MIRIIDNFLNGITMYRLMLYFLILLILASLLFSFIGVVPFSPVNIIFSALIFISVCWTANKIFSKVLKVPTNLESVYITALILTLIVTPVNNFSDILIFAVIGFISQAGKYILVINKKHIFNPATLAVFVSFILFKEGASWWVGTVSMLPLMLIGGFLIIKKVQRFGLFFSFTISYLLIISTTALLRGNDLFVILQNILAESPLFFFAFVILTEPLTTPPTLKRQILYGAGVGSLFITPETALLVGNIFSYLVSPKERLRLKLKEKIKLAPDIYDFVFMSDKRLNYIPGQYMEWTLSHPNPDSRGVRRYFTLASSPTEENLRIGVKFYPDSSSFKKSLINFTSGREIVASQLAGEFTLPKDEKQKLCFMAGGIGITPYRSMIQYLLNTNNYRDIILIYSNKTEEMVYKDIFNHAKRVGVKTVYVVTDKTGHIDAKMIKKEAPDYKDRVFYISGPRNMVEAFRKILKDMGIKNSQIKVDFFPGYV